MLPSEVITAIADELAAAERDRRTIPLLTARYPEMTVADSYAVQNEWRRRGIANGRKPIGRKIGLTSKVMQAATGITEPDYGAIFDDMVYENGVVIEHGRFANVRIEVELAFVLGAPIDGPGATIFDVMRATEYVVPALEILSSRIDLTGRTIVDTISDNAAMGGLVYGGNPVRPNSVDLRWVSAQLYRNETIEESGVAPPGVKPTPAGGARVGEKQAPHRDPRGPPGHGGGG
ncbi:2-oxo-hepta-3-ene-1,7-dioate hydratase, partial [Nocardia brasiliensis]|uniref:2-oxo-hepta-3-ene-1,7-dioate hydratase n=1 Tax=Nocardia brasiliensis TaxID=37326 RepID=UPI002456EFAC